MQEIVENLKQSLGGPHTQKLDVKSELKKEEKTVGIKLIIDMNNFKDRENRKNKNKEKKYE